MHSRKAIVTRRSYIYAFYLTGKLMCSVHFFIVLSAIFYPVLTVVREYMIFYIAPAFECNLAIHRRLIQILKPTKVCQGPDKKWK